jgi:hypothetical protein
MMEIFKNTVVFSTAAFLCACGSPEGDQVQGGHSDTTKVDHSQIALDPIWGADTTTTINFTDVSVKISRLIVFDEEGALQSTIGGDSVVLWIELGEGIEGQRIFVSSDQLINLNVAQRYETSVTAAGDGPHCDLIDWKHFTSAWNDLASPARNQFIAEEYTDEMSRQFPEVSIDDAKKEVERMCEGWGDVVKDATSVTEYPFVVGISRIWLRITGEHIDTGEKVEKIIEFGVPMGC